jgi:hypothetical protein
METAVSSETFSPMYQTTWHQISEEHYIHIYCQQYNQSISTDYYQLLFQLIYVHSSICRLIKAWPTALTLYMQQRAL